MENNSMKNNTLRVKIITMGDVEVGKSCIIKRYCEKRFIHKYLITIGIDYGVTKVSIRNRDVRVNIFDMAGHPLFYEVRNEFYRDTQGALMVFDVCSRKSFEDLEQWRMEMKTEMQNNADADNVTVCVCANKVDRHRVVDEMEGRLWANKYGFHYFETSALSGEGITEMFKTLLEDMVVSAENGGKRQSLSTKFGYSKEQLEAIQRLKSSQIDYEQLGLYPSASRDDINKAYRKLAVLLHPDKSVVPGSEEAFKILVAAKTAMLKRCQ